MTRWLMPITVTVALLVALAVVAAGCGGGGSTGELEPSEHRFAEYPKGPTRQFIVPGGSDNTVQEFGREATAAERRQVSVMVEGWLRARVAGEWDDACSYLEEDMAAYALRAASHLSGKMVTKCPEALAIIAPVEEPPKDNIKGGVASLRIGQGQGYAQYHGREGKDWILLVKREMGHWRIAQLQPLERFK